MPYYLEGHGSATDAEWFLSASECYKNTYLVNNNGSSVCYSNDSKSWMFTRPNRQLENEMLTKKFNCRFAHSFVITIDPLSINSSYGDCTHIIHTIFIKALHKVSSNDIDIEWLGVVEKSNYRGIHMHLTGFYYRSFTKKMVDTIYDILTKAKFTMKPIIATKDNPKDVNCTLLVSDQKVKSIASYINYLKKDPQCVMSNVEDLLYMFANFERTHIFDESSMPKRQKRSADIEKINSNNELVIFLNTQMQKGNTSLQEILMLPASQAFLHISNLNSIYQNVYMQFVASCFHENNILGIINKFISNKQDLGCACPMLELLVRNNINVISFIDEMFIWLSGSDKKNTLCFEGPPNSGKSTVAKLIWELFPIHTRVIQDGIFSFANLINSGCGLWEEPYIDQTIIDTSKLILEGEPSVQIAIKNKSSQSLGKRVPMIITTNRELSYFVSSEHDALDVRTFRYNMCKPFNISDSCKSINHYCSNVTGSAGSATDRLPADKSSTTSEPFETQACTLTHKLLREHVLTFIVYCLKINEQKVATSFCRKSIEISQALHSIDFSDFDYFLNTCSEFPQNIDL